MKTYKELSEELDNIYEVIGFAQRQKMKRRLILLSKKASTKMRKLRNARKSMPTNVDAKASKQVRTGIMQRMVGKAKNLGSMAVGQKIELAKKVDKKMKAMAAKVKMLVKKKKKEIIKKHREKKKEMMSKHKASHK